MFKFSVVLPFFAALALWSCAPGDEKGLVSKSVTGDPSGSGQIVGGTQAQGSEAFARAVVMIYGESEEGRSFTCTGTFVSEKTILTAGHCVVKDVSKMIVFFSPSPYTDEKAVKLSLVGVVVHEKYQTSAQADQQLSQKSGTTNSIDSRERNDLALIFFTGGLPWGAQVAGLGLFPAPKSSLRLVGYGRTQGGEQTESDEGVLRTVVLKSPLISQSNSKKSFSLLQTNGKGACFGDSGGPAFAVNSSEKVVIVGVASGVFSTGRSNEPSDFCKQKSIYMSVESYRDWILKNSNF